VLFGLLSELLMESDGYRGQLRSKVSIRLRGDPRLAKAMQKGQLAKGKREACRLKGK